ncbi:PAZ domain-containing protein/Piwi domain-containing protein/DUF1785 domain-containing protein [Cephalotus follicularis]|uniref:PAZ domain-containing protein/Piwi domain-containing protein/DUF1785 domain-containing protein n=1 Tax=Cephalotus follicularis TaxID=3775 RepID=A0A1Q3DDJ1_CEPFO|nr:PAZ domain-containing protein/Piwi domain-containing protein/DUF1785 domain-containing protein [Cephalotus follicularis]
MERGGYRGRAGGGGDRRQGQVGPIARGGGRGGHGSGGVRGRGWRGPTGSRGPTSPTAVTLHSQRSSSLPVSEPVIPAMQSLTLSENLPENLAKLLPLKRPDSGGTYTIQNLRLHANFFAVEYSPTRMIWQYDFDIKPKLPPEHGQPVMKLPKSILSIIRNNLSSNHPKEFPLTMTAHDGRKNIFSAIPLQPGEFKVVLSEEDDRKAHSYICTLNLVSELSYCKLSEYLSGSVLPIPRDILQGLDVVMKENPTRQMICAGRRFFTTKLDRRDDLGHGIIASRGFRHSLKPTSQCLALCLDHSVLAFRKPIPVIKFLEEHIDGFNTNNFDAFREKVDNALKRLKVALTHRVTKMKFTIAGLTEKNTRYLSFVVQDSEGIASPRDVSLVDYYREKYSKDIEYKDIPCLELGKNGRKNQVPMEFCILAEGQRYPKEDLDRNAAKNLKDMSLVPPKVRQNMICNMVRDRDGPCGGEIAHNFGIRVSMNMTRVTGRVLRPPEIKVSTSSGEVMRITVDKQKCNWNFIKRSVVEGKSVGRWAVLDFSSSSGRFSLNPDQFIPAFMDRCRSLRIHLGEPLVYKPTTMNKLSNVDTIRELLDWINEWTYKNSEGRLQILVCVMAREDEGYKYLKWYSETILGMMTQCCLSPSANKVNDQYLLNLALKINAKLGGSNFELMSGLPHFGGEGHAMFIGADVNHPGPLNTTSPSMAAVVASMNWPAVNHYAARIHPQDHRKEKIVKFADMCLELLKAYVQLNKVKPGRVVIFRDGVSESQFDMLLNEELVDLKRAFRAMNYSPTITLIVAQKRHQTRLFPEGERDGGSTGNVPPGTVVDTGITHHSDFDFYLCSHYGSIGTSKPTHYQVLWDDHEFTSNGLQQLIYDLCFTYARCTKSVSLVPPVYYADLVAYRGQHYHQAVIAGQSAASAASSSSSLVSSFNEQLYRLHPDLENSMFFV